MGHYFDRFDLLLLTVISGWIILTPFTKVEESFNIQATHDILFHGFEVKNHDHQTFPGPVPRTFLGAAFLAGLATPVVALIQYLYLPKLLILYIVRFLLGCTIWIMLLRLRASIARHFGYRVSKIFAFFLVIQPHFLYYMSRTLPNTFAMILVLFGISEWIRSFSGEYKYCRRTIFVLSLATVCFRCDIAVFLVPIILSMLISKRLSMYHVISSGLIGTIMGLMVSVPLDSYFWGHLLWPEGQVLWFNTILNKSNEWGTSPCYWYFLYALPKALLGLWLVVPFSFFRYTKRGCLAILDPDTMRICTAVILYVGLYSFLPHKELRFIFPALPLCTLLAAVGAHKISGGFDVLYKVREYHESDKYLLPEEDEEEKEKRNDDDDDDTHRTGTNYSRKTHTTTQSKKRFTDHPKKEKPTAQSKKRFMKPNSTPTFSKGRTFGILLVTVSSSITVTGTIFFGTASFWNYPGGYALQHAHRIMDESLIQQGQYYAKMGQAEAAKYGQIPLNTSSLFPWPLPLPPTPTRHNPYDQTATLIENKWMYSPPGLIRYPYSVHMEAVATMTGVSRFGERGWPWKYSKKETIFPATDTPNGVRFKMLLTEYGAMCQKNGWTLAHTEYAFDTYDFNDIKILFRSYMYGVRRVINATWKKKSVSYVSRIIKIISYCLTRGSDDFKSIVEALFMNTLRLKPKVYVCHQL